MSQRFGLLRCRVHPDTQPSVMMAPGGTAICCFILMAVHAGVLWEPHTDNLSMKWWSWSYSIVSFLSTCPTKELFLSQHFAHSLQLLSSFRSLKIGHKFIDSFFLVKFPILLKRGSQKCCTCHSQQWGCRALQGVKQWRVRKNKQKSSCSMIYCFVCKIYR